MRTRNFIVIILLVLILAGACTKRPKDVLDEKQMVELLADLQMAHAYYGSSGAAAPRPDREALDASVLEKHGVTQEELDSTIAYYGRNIDEYQALFVKVEKELRSRNGQVEEIVVENDIWPYSHFTVFFPTQMSDGINFSFPADELEPGDKIEWRMRLSSPQGVEAMLGIEYENGVTSLVKRSTSGNNTMKIELITDTARTATRIFGVITAPITSMPLWTDSIRLIKTEFDSLEYSRFRSQKRIYAPRPKPRPEPETPSDTTLTVSNAISKTV